MLWLWFLPWWAYALALCLLGVVGFRASIEMIALAMPLYRPQVRWYDATTINLTLALSRLLAASVLFALAAFLFAVLFVDRSGRLARAGHRLVSRSARNLAVLQLPPKVGHGPSTVAPATCYHQPSAGSESVLMSTSDNLMRVYDVLVERPDVTETIEEMVAWEDRHPADGQWEGRQLGWEGAEVHCSPATCTYLLYTAKVINQTFSSRSSTRYALVSADDAKEALRMIRAVPEGKGPTRDFATLFSDIVGLDDAKVVLLQALRATAPVHVMLIGPPASGKSVLLEDIGNLPGAEFYDAKAATRAGLTNLLVTRAPTYLVLDEVDKARGDDINALLTLLASGIATRLHGTSSERKTLPTKVFAGANDLSKMSDFFASRFLKVPVNAYTKREFLEVAMAILTHREGLGPVEARNVIEAVEPYSHNVRDAIQVARATKDRPELVEAIARTMFPDARPPRQLSLLHP